MYVYGGTSAENQKSDAYFLQEQMVLRHHNEAESLNAVQKMDWEWKVNEITGPGQGGVDQSVPLMDDLHIPMVHVSDDFDMSIS